MAEIPIQRKARRSVWPLLLLLLLVLAAAWYFWSRSAGATNTAPDSVRTRVDQGAVVRDTAAIRDTTKPAAAKP